MILTGSAIRSELEAQRLLIQPFVPTQLNPNSYNLTLGKRLMTYTLPAGILDSIKENQTEMIVIPSSGIVLKPNILYLGETAEVVGSDHYVPIITGRSSIGRLGLNVHVTAGLADIGFKGNITLELVATHPIKVYAGMEICQVYYNTVTGERTMYQGKYQDATGPEASKFHLEHDKVMQGKL